MLQVQVSHKFNSNVEFGYGEKKKKYFKDYALWNLNEKVSFSVCKPKLTSVRTISFCKPKMCCFLKIRNMM